MAERLADEQKALELVVAFAEKQPEIFAVHKGVTPEEGTPALYFLTGSEKGYCFGLDGPLTELDLEIFNEANYSVGLFSWPTDKAEN